MKHKKKPKNYLQLLFYLQTDLVQIFNNLQLFPTSSFSLCNFNGDIWFCPFHQEHIIDRNSLRQISKICSLKSSVSSRKRTQKNQQGKTLQLRDFLEDSDLRARTNQSSTSLRSLLTIKFSILPQNFFPQSKFGFSF